MGKENRLKMETEILGEMMKEDDGERRGKGGHREERDTGESETEETGRQERRDPDRGGHGRARREMEQGKRREAVRKK